METERRLFCKGDRVRRMGFRETGTVYEDETERYGPFGNTVVVHWDGKPSPTGGPEDMVTSHNRLLLVDPATEQP